MFFKWLYVQEQGDLVRKLKTEKATEIEVKHILFSNHLFSRYIELRLSIHSFPNVCLNVMNSKSKNLPAKCLVHVISLLLLLLLMPKQNFLLVRWSMWIV